jgi:hypothetical protein
LAPAAQQLVEERLQEVFQKRMKTMFGAGWELRISEARQSAELALVEAELKRDVQQDPRWRLLLQQRDQNQAQPQQQLQAQQQLKPQQQQQQQQQQPVFPAVWPPGAPTAQPPQMFGEMLPVQSRSALVPPPQPPPLVPLAVPCYRPMPVQRAPLLHVENQASAAAAAAAAAAGVGVNAAL